MEPPSNIHRRTRQLCCLLFFLILPCAGTFAAKDRTSYSSHCPSPAPAPDRLTDVGDNVELLKPFHFSNGFFSGIGTESLFYPDLDGSRYFSFLPHGVSSRTAYPDLLHLTATLTLFGHRVEEHNSTRDRDASWRLYDVAISFHLDGYYSSTTSELCMVGTGTEAAETDGPVKHYVDVSLRLRVPSHPGLTDPFVVGHLEGADFETVSLVTYAEGDVYEHTGRASACPLPATTRRTILQPQHGGFSCAALRAQVMSKYRLEYASRHASRNSSTSSSLPRLHEPVMTVNQMRCAANGAVRLYAAFSNDRSLWKQPVDRFLVEEQAIVAEGFWDSETSRLCLHACLVVRLESGPSATENFEVRECGIGMSFWFPAIWTIRDRSSTAALLWNASQAASGGNVNSQSVLIPDLITASSFQKIIRSNLSEVKYIYNKTMLETAKRHYLEARSRNNDKKIEVSSLGNYTCRDFEFMFFTNGGIGSGRAYPVSIGSAMVNGDKLAAEISFSRHAAAEMKQNRLVNVSYGVLYEITPTDWTNGYATEIKAEGVYDTKAGLVSMVGCRELNVSTDCQVLIAVQFTLSEESQKFGHGKGRISSLRNNTDVLYFEPRNITLYGMYSEEVSQSIWRMDLESVITLVSSTLACVFAVLQILHTKRNRDAAPATSITMLVVLALGSAIPLAVDLDALLVKWSEPFVQLTGNGLLELKDLVLRAPALIATVLQLRLLRLAWVGRRSSSTESRVLLVCLPLYLIGAVVTAAVQAENSRAERKDPLFVHFGRDPGTLWGALASYDGLVTDAFLLPQVVLNLISGSRANKVISPWFYAGGTMIRVAPHVYDVARSRRHVRSMRPSYIYASPRDGLFGSVAWDAVATCGAASLALLLFLQQRLGGDFFVRWRSR